MSRTKFIADFDQVGKINVIHLRPNQCGEVCNMSSQPQTPCSTYRFEHLRYTNRCCNPLSRFCAAKAGRRVRYEAPLHLPLTRPARANVGDLTVNRASLSHRLFAHFISPPPIQSLSLRHPMSRLCLLSTAAA